MGPGAKRVEALTSLSPSIRKAATVRRKKMVGAYTREGQDSIQFMLPFSTWVDCRARRLPAHWLIRDGGPVVVAVSGRFCLPPVVRNLGYLTTIKCDA